MTDRDFFRNSARECRQMAVRARSDNARAQLWRWAREFEALADGQGTATARTMPHRQREMAAAD